MSGCSDKLLHCHLLYIIKNNIVEWHRCFFHFSIIVTFVLFIPLSLTVYPISSIHPLLYRSIYFTSFYSTLFYFILTHLHFIFFAWYQESVLPLHQGVLFVFLVALVEATCWYAAYQTINLTGEPYTYNQEFPPTVVASLILQVKADTIIHSYWTLELFEI